MTAMRGVNLVLRFFLELGMLAALVYWGFSTHEGALQKVLFGIGAPLVVAVVWGLFVAPKAVRPVPLPWRLLIEAVLFGAAVIALAAAGRTTLAWVFLAVVVVNEVMLLIARE